MRVFCEEFIFVFALKCFVLSIGVICPKCYEGIREVGEKKISFDLISLSACVPPYT